MKITRLLGAMAAVAVLTLSAAPALAYDPPTDLMLTQPHELGLAVIPTPDKVVQHVAEITLDVFTNFAWDPKPLDAASCVASHSAAYCAAAMGTASSTSLAGPAANPCKPWEDLVLDGDGYACICVKPI